MILKQIFLVLLLSLGISDDISRIAKINRATKEAEKAFINKDYKTAIEKYSYLINTLGVDDDKALLNLGHAYYHSNQLDDAYATYTLVTSSEDPLLRSIAWQQLAVLDYQRKDTEKALYHCKQALKANPRNEEVRLNYEFLKKMDKSENDQQQKNQQEDKKNQKQDQQKEGQGKQEQEEKQKSEEQQKNKNNSKQEEQKNGQQEQSKKSTGEGEEKENKQKQTTPSGQDKKDQKEGTGMNPKQQQQEEAEKGKKEGEKEKMVVDREQLERMNLTEEKARMLLDAMRQKEVQYIQQKQHKGSSKSDKSKPDW